jgi:hypothetical protein
VKEPIGSPRLLSLVILSVAACSGDGSGPTDTDLFIDYIFPQRIAATQASVEVRVVGAGFTSAATGLVNGAPRQTIFYDSGLLGVVVTTNDLAQAQTLSITVEIGPERIQSNAVSLEVFNDTPLIQGVTPSEITVGHGSFPDTLLGRGFSPTTVVRVNGQDRQTTVLDAGLMIVQIPASDIAQKGVLQISARTPGNPPVISNTVSLPVVAAHQVTAISVLPLRGQALAYDSLAERLYVAMVPVEPANPDSVAVVDPSTGQVVRYFEVAPGPRQLVISPDGRFLYVLSSDAPVIDRFELSTGSSLRIALHDDPMSGPSRALDLAVIPDHTSSILVALVDPMTGFVLIVFDDAVPRPRQSGGAEFVEATEQPGLMYGLVGRQFLRILLRSDGVLIGARLDGLTEVSEGSIQYARPWVYGSSGGVYDLEAGSRVGVLKHGAHLVDPENRRAYSLEGSVSRIWATSTETFESLGSVVVSGATDLRGNLVRWGVDGLALFTGDQHVLLIRTTLVQQ